MSMTINFISPEGFERASEIMKEHIEKQERETPVLAMCEEGAATIGLAAIGGLALKSGIKRLASCESTYGGVGPIITAVLGAGAVAGAIFVGKRTAKTAKAVHEKFSKVSKKDPKVVDAEFKVVDESKKTDNQ